MKLRPKKAKKPTRIINIVCVDQTTQANAKAGASAILYKPTKDSVTISWQAPIPPGVAIIPNEPSTNKVTPAKMDKCAVSGKAKNTIQILLHRYLMRYTKSMI